MGSGLHAPRPILDPVKDLALHKACLACEQQGYCSPTLGPCASHNVVAEPSACVFVCVCVSVVCVCVSTQELQAARLCKAEQVKAFKASCLVFGLDLSAQQQQRPGAAADPVAALRDLLDR